MNAHTHKIVALALVGLFACNANDDVNPGSTVQSQECLQNSDSDYRVLVSGAGLTDHNSARVEIATEMQLAFSPHVCATQTQTQVAEGAFLVELDNRTDGAAYPAIAVYLDINQDGRCTPETDLGWFTLGSVSPGSELEVELSLQDFGHAGELEVCGYFESAQ